MARKYLTRSEAEKLLRASGKFSSVKVWAIQETEGHFIGQTKTLWLEVEVKYKKK